MRENQWEVNFSQFAVYELFRYSELSEYNILLREGGKGQFDCEHRPGIEPEVTPTAKPGLEENEIGKTRAGAF